MCWRWDGPVVLTPLGYNDVVVVVVPLGCDRGVRLGYGGKDTLDTYLSSDGTNR